MPRIRTVKPEFWGDEKLAPLDAVTRLVFLGLISMADDAGRLLDNVKQIDAFIFPETDDSSRDALARLARLVRIRRGMTASGQKVIQIEKWRDHQKVDHPNLKACLPELVRTPAVTAVRETGANDSRAIPEPLAPRPTTYDLRPTTGDQGATSAPPREAIENESREPREHAATGPGSAETASGTPEGLHQNNYATRLLEEIGLPTLRQNIEFVAAAIVAHSKQAAITKAAAFEFIKARAVEAQEAGESVNQFWFADGKYRPTSQAGRKLSRKEEFDAAFERTERDRLAKGNT